MKTLSLLFAAVCVLFCYTSCDKIDDLKTVDFTATLEQDIDVVVEESGLRGIADAPYPFSAQATLSLEDNDDVKDYLDKLEKMEVTEVTALVFSVNPGEEILSMNLNVAGTGFAYDFPAIASDMVGVDLAISASSQMLTEVGNKLLSAKKVTLNLTGTTSAVPMNFRVKLKFKTKIEAEAL